MTAAFDPFADDAETDTAPKETNNVTTGPWTPADDRPTQTEVSVTLKGGAGFDAPWVVMRAPDVPGARELVEDTENLRPLLDGTHKAGKYFASLGAPAAGAPAQAAPSRPAREVPPNGETRQCQHGEMTFKSGISASTGRAWKAFMCPTPKNTPGQCPPEFIR